MKKIAAMVLALAFVASTATVTMAGSYVECKVKSVDNGKVVLDCGADAGKLNVGADVKVKKAKKRTMIEGC